ncbi:MAG: thioredoxin family protein [Deltaproteobacteria bacterium]|nr:thioredoxin family protein [Deltaproteobacteria bacterium]
MTPAEEKQIKALNETLAKEIQIKCLHNEHKQSHLIQQFCDHLSQQVPKIRVKKETGDPDDIPGIHIHDRLSFQAVPSGTEIGPFIDALQLVAEDNAQMDEDIASQLKAIDLPTHLVLYVAAQCSFCPQAVRQILPLVIANRHIHLTVVDAMSFPKLAEKDNLQSVPTLILEDQFRWTGSFQTNEIIEVMAKRDLSALGPQSLEMLLKEGKAGQLAEMMLEKAQIFPAFYELLIHQKWPVRLGAMVVMDELIEKNLSLALQTVESLWRKFDNADDRVKGDLLYIFGEMAQEDFVPRIEAVLRGQYDNELKEAAEEALDKIKAATDGDQNLSR